MTSAQWLWLVLLSVLWGGAFFFIGVAVHELPPLTIVLARVGLGAVVLWVIVFASARSVPREIGVWGTFAGMALFNNVIPFTAIVAGQQSISSGLASVLNATTPVWAVLLLATLTSDEPLTGRRIAGVVLGALGVAILIGPAALAGETSDLRGMVLVLLATFSYGCSAVWGRRLRGTAPIISATGQLTCSTLLLAPIVFLIDQPWALPAPGLSTVAAIVGLAIPGTALAYLVFFHIITVSGTANVMLVTLLIPVSAVALGVAFLGEELLMRHVLGGLVIAAGLVVIDGRVLRLLRTRFAGAS